jgi:hypothetical protein
MLLGVKLKVAIFMICVDFNCTGDNRMSAPVLEKVKKNLFVKLA